MCWHLLLLYISCIFTRTKKRPNERFATAKERQRGRERRSRREKNNHCALIMFLALLFLATPKMITYTRNPYLRASYTWPSEHIVRFRFRRRFPCIFSLVTFFSHYLAFSLRPRDYQHWWCIAQRTCNDFRFVNDIQPILYCSFVLLIQKINYENNSRIRFDRKTTEHEHTNT